MDPARLVASYSTGRPPPSKPATGGRGDARPLLSIPAVPLIDAADVLEPGEKRVWRVSGALPPRAPPTVGGVAVKVGYRLAASARHAVSSGDPGAPATGPWTDARAAVPVVVWPHPPRSRPPPGALAVGTAAAATGVVQYEPGCAVAGGSLAVVEVAPSAAGAAAAARAAAADAPALALSPVQRRASASHDGADGSGDGGGGGTAEAAPQRPTFVLRGAGGAELARLTLTAPPDGWLVPGATLRGALDLSAAAAAGDGAGPVAVRYTASLETIETLAPAFAPPPPRGAPSASRGVVRRAVVDEVRDEVAHLLATDFALSVPPLATPTLATPLASTAWMLRLEVAASGGGGGAPPPPLLEWELPVAVYAE